VRFRTSLLLVGQIFYFSYRSRPPRNCQIGWAEDVAGAGGTDDVIEWLMIGKASGKR